MRTLIPLSLFLMLGALAGCMPVASESGSDLLADADGVEISDPEDEINFIPAFLDPPTEVPPTFTPLPPTATPWPTATIPPTPTVDPLASAGPPIRLEVPALGIDAYVEEVGLTADRAMDVPQGWMNAGWYKNGARPGEVGNAVIAGHFDTSSGGPAVFWDLRALAPGDEVIVTYERGDRFTFVVEGSQEFDYDAEGEAIDVVFGPSQTEDLNLITCQGVWDRTQSTYDRRLVVYTRLAPEKTVRVGLDGTYD